MSEIFIETGGDFMRTKIVEKADAPSQKPQNVYRFLLLVVGEALLFLFLFLAGYLMDSHLDVRFWFSEPVSASAVYGTVLLMLLISGLLPDFLRSFVYSLKNREQITKMQIERSLLSVKLAMAAAVAAELFVLVFSFVSMMSGLLAFAGELEEVLPASLAAFGGMAVHGVLAVIILLPVYARLKVRLLSMQ